MADVTIDAAISTATSRGMRSRVWVSADVGYQFYIDSGGTFVYSKTTDGGATWGAAVTIESATTNLAFDVWYDQWTPGSSGTLIHLAYFDSTADDMYYRSLDTTGSPTDSLGTRRVVFAGATAAASMSTVCSITKARSGNLYIAFEIDAGVERGFYRSTDSGVNWTSRTNGVLTGGNQWALLFPATGTGDDQDVFALRANGTTNNVTLDFYDDSANAWTLGSTLVGSIVDNTTDGTGQFLMSASIRHSDGHIIASILSERDSATGDHRVFDCTDHDTFSELTAIATNIDDHYNSQVFIDQSTDDIYVAYQGKRDGSEVIGLTARVYYVKSTDGGSTWSAGDTAYEQGTADESIHQLWSGLMGARFDVAWRSDSTVLKSNKVNSVTFSASGDVTATVTGASSAAQAGTVTVTGDALTTLTGASSAAQAGTVTATTAVDVTVVLTGVSSAGAAGDAASTGGATADTTGVQSAAQVGTLDVQGSATADLTGVSSASAAGDLTVLTGSDATVDLVGVAASSEAGTVAIVIDVAADTTGVASQAQAGTVTITGDANVELVGVSSAAAAGTVAASEASDATASVSGVASQAQAGTVQVAVDATAVTQGVSSQAQAGTVTAAADATADLTGVSAQTAAGGVVAFDADASVTLVGVSASSEAGTVTAFGPDVTVVLVGVSASADAGQIVGVGDQASTTQPTSGSGVVMPVRRRRTKSFIGTPDQPVRPRKEKPKREDVVAILRGVAARGFAGAPLVVIDESMRRRGIAAALLA